MEIHEHAASEIVEHIAQGVLCPKAVFEHQRSRIQDLNGSARAFAHVSADDPISSERGLLAGLPVSVKDQIHVLGMPCTSGYEGLRDFVPSTESPVVSKLKQSGARVLGKTNMPPLGMDFQTFNSMHGRTNNPWNPKFTAGGSTGGGAAALALRMSFLEIGADLAGSLRIPASFCGICSLMPGFGKLSTRGTMTLVEQAGKTVDYLPRIGPMARSVDDLVLAWQAISDEPPLVIDRPRIAISAEHQLLPRHPQIACVMDQLHDRLQASSEVEFTTSDPDDFDWRNAWQAYGQIQGYQLGAMTPWIQRLAGRILSRGARRRSPNFIGSIQDGYRRRKPAYHRALMDRERLSRCLDRFLARFDAWVLPVTLVPAFEHITPSFDRGVLRDYEQSFDVGSQTLNYFEALTRLTIPFNLTGHPVVVIPAGKDTSTGIPIGIQLVGARDGESRLLSVARSIQSSIELRGRWVPNATMC